MRAIWSGAISFGLVNIPVRLYSATQDESFHFNYLHKEDMSPVRYAKICRKDGKELSSEEIVKGYEYQRGDYIVMEDDDFKKAHPKTTKTIEIQDFTAEKEIDSRYFDKPYYLEPDKGAARPYALLREALRKSGKVGVAKFVIRNKEHLGALKVEGDMILLNQMRYSAEIRSKDELNLPTEKVEAREIKMALALIDQLSSDFKPEQYKDTYRTQMEKVIKDKAKGKPIKATEDAPVSTDVADLMETLRASLEKQHGEVAETESKDTKKATAK
jgi:DNA end-binding protein Ku